MECHSNMISNVVHSRKVVHLFEPGTDWSGKSAPEPAPRLRRVYNFYFQGSVIRCKRCPKVLKENRQC